MITKNEIASYNDYGKVMCISNGTIEAYITLDVGPRIIRFGFVGGQNFMRDERSAFEPKDDKEFTDFFGEGKKWENLGGHRIWLSPESYPETYYPDLDPVKCELTEQGAIFTPNAEVEIGVAKQLEIRMGDGCDMQVIMRATNISNEDKEFSIWGLTVSNMGGNVIIPMNTNDTGLLSNRIISVWPYTDMSDRRIYWGKKYVTVNQTPAAEQPLKLGFDLNGGKVYYVLGNEVFCKTYKTEHPTAKYPDGGCSFETYDCDQFIEVESLGELKTVKPQETSELCETWTLTKTQDAVNRRDDESIEAFLNNL